MHPVNRFLLLATFLLLSATSFAQVSFYQPDTSVKVYAYGNLQTLAWCGGFNNPQFSMADLNRDGKKDLVVFEPNFGVKTFINRGVAGAPDYRYEPAYALNFPPLYSYLVLADYNCDGIADLFHRGGTGFSVYKGFYNWGNQLCFSFYKELYYSNDVATGGPANAYVNPGDIPAIADIDNDGDVDFISYYITGGYMHLYKNMRVELGLPCDSLPISLKDKCWGKVYQGFYRTHLLGYSCSNAGLLKPMANGGGNPNLGQKVTHSGNTPTAFDWDMDGDYDYLDGSVSYNELTFLKNGRVETGYPVDTMISQDTVWQTGGKQVNIAVWPTAYNIDIDNDGKKDILVSPNSGTAAENYNCIWFYKNLTTPGAPNWQYQSDSFLIDKSIDLGSASYPMLFDYNKDGKLDLLIGSDGYRQSSGLLRSRMSLYKNTSTPGNPAFALETTDFMGMYAYNFQGIAPAAGDIDFDGKADLVIGHTDGTLSYFQNTAATDAVQPVWALTLLQLTDENGDTINAGGNAAPFIYDIDKDGKKDLVIGNLYGYLDYYQNVATTPGAIKLRHIKDRLGNAKADPSQVIGNYSVPFIGKIDSTGNDYILLGSNSGNLYRYTGFQTGDTTINYTLLESQYSYIDTTYNFYNHPGEAYGVYGGRRTAVTVGDLDSSGSYSMIVGNVKGGVEFYKRKVYTVNIPNLDEENGSILLYPNPAEHSIHISWNGILHPEVEISIISADGRKCYTGKAHSGMGHTSVSVESLANGVYVCIVQSGNKRYYNKFTVVR
jgi:hypothetical protein